MTGNIEIMKLQQPHEGYAYDSLSLVPHEGQITALQVGHADDSSEGAID
jgi:hypothetical protein